MNVLLALLDDIHRDHEAAQAWWARDVVAGGRAWSTCVVTENGFARIASQPSYPGAVTTMAAIDLLDRATDHPQHRFWPDDISLTDRGRIERRAVLGHRQVTDVYLLALAVAHDGRLVTLDRGVSTSAVPGATEDHLLVL